MNTDITKVVFRKFDDGSVIAIFPEEPASYDGDECNSYMHHGQHGGASLRIPYWTTPATEEEYRDLKQELESEPYNYNLNVYQRITREMRKNFQRNQKELK